MPHQKEIRGIVVRPGQAPVIEAIENTFDGYKKAVSHIANDPSMYFMRLFEDMEIIGSESSQMFNQKHPQYGTRIFGDFLVLKLTKASGYVDVTDEDFEKIKATFVQ